MAILRDWHFTPMAKDCEMYHEAEWMFLDDDYAYLYISISTLLYSAKRLSMLFISVILGLVLFSMLVVHLVNCEIAILHCTTLCRVRALGRVIRAYSQTPVKVRCMGFQSQIFVGHTPVWGNKVFSYRYNEHTKFTTSEPARFSLVPWRLILCRLPKSTLTNMLPLHVQWSVKTDLTRGPSPSHSIYHISHLVLFISSPLFETLPSICHIRLPLWFTLELYALYIITFISCSLTLFCLSSDGQHGRGPTMLHVHFELVGSDLSTRDVYSRKCKNSYFTISRWVRGCKVAKS